MSILLVGCSKPSLVGKWNVTGTKGLPPGSTLVMEFTDSKYSGDLTISQMGANIKIKSDGNYTFDGKKVVMTTTSSKIDESTVPAALKAMLPMIKQQMDAQNGKAIEGETKIEGDTVTITDKDSSQTLTRIK
jgi:hypothetical protein